MIYAVKGMEAREVKRERRGLRWCPWCDTSAPSHLGDCPKCHAEFTGNPIVTNSASREIVFTANLVIPDSVSVALPSARAAKARKPKKARKAKKGKKS